MSNDRTIVKICGVTRLEDARVALAAGADWLGFIRWPRSPRFRPIDELADLLSALRADPAAPPFDAVGVYVNAAPADIESELARAGFDRIQLHGDEPSDFASALARDLARPILKAVPIIDESSLARAAAYEGVDLLTDAHDPARRGGTGRPFDYALLRPLAARRRVIVGGGLTAETVAAVIRDVRPWGVDVSSAVETAPGVKDAALVRRFIDAVRNAGGVSPMT